MKNKATKITLLYILFSILVAVIGYYVLYKFHTTQDAIFLNYSFGLRCLLKNIKDYNSPGLRPWAC